ncbi:C39 family peptidase [Petroclostridium xylanilyticum]|uniref:C39 family peptidase n=1 Tax=Petroclostridium xylanilyticum TaxID=1792311 RepID=UPI0018E33606
MYFNQADKRWADRPYGKTGTIGTSGCGPTSLAMVVSSLLGHSSQRMTGDSRGVSPYPVVDPVQMSEWVYKNGYRCEGNGSYHSLISDGARHFGLKAEGCTANEPQKIVDALANGKLVVAIMGNLRIQRRLFIPAVFLFGRGFKVKSYEVCAAEIIAYFLKRCYTLIIHHFLLAAHSGEAANAALPPQALTYFNGKGIPRICRRVSAFFVIKEIACAKFLWISIGKGYRILR